MALGPVDDFFVCFCSLPSHSKEISEVLVREYKKFIFYLMGDNEDAYLTCLDFFLTQSLMKYFVSRIVFYLK